MKWTTLLCLVVLMKVSQGVADEFTMTLMSPNLTIPQDMDILLCSSSRVPIDARFLVTIIPKPILGTPYHLNVILCDEPGYQSPEGLTTGSDPVWECGSRHFGERSSFLPNAPECLNGGQYLTYQYQSGPPDEGSFILPHGTGVPVGDGTAFRTIISMYHFYQTKALVNESTAGFAIDFSFSREAEVTPVYGMQIVTHGFLQANSVGTVSGSWTLKKETKMDIQLLYTHWHSLTTDVLVWINRKNGDRVVILRQDPHSFSGISDVSNSTSAVMRTGDQLTIECVYNNTKEQIIRVETIEMCVLATYFTTDGPKSPADPLILSFDPFYKDCDMDFVVASNGTSINYEGVSSFHGPDLCP